MNMLNPDDSVNAIGLILDNWDKFDEVERSKIGDKLRLAFLRNPREVQAQMVRDLDESVHPQALLLKTILCATNNN